MVALRLMPAPDEITLVTKEANVSVAGVGVELMVVAPPPMLPPHWMPRSRPALRCASRMRTSRFTCWPPLSVMVLTMAGLPYWATISSTFCIVTASVTLPPSRTRPLTELTLTLELGSAERIERAMSAVSTPTSTASSPTGAPSAENRLTVVVPKALPTR